MWDKDDHLGRWVQGICAIFLGIFGVVCGWYSLNNLVYVYLIGGLGLAVGSLRLCWRCAVYALTGTNNVNRDDY